jgi:hypothetical protein
MFEIDGGESMMMVDGQAKAITYKGEYIDYAECVYNEESLSQFLAKHECGAEYVPNGYGGTDCILRYGDGESIWFECEIISSYGRVQELVNGR